MVLDSAIYIPEHLSKQCVKGRVSGLHGVKKFDGLHGIKIEEGCLSTQSPLAMPLHVIYSSILAGPTHAMDARVEPNPTVVFHICLLHFQFTH